MSPQIPLSILLLVIISTPHSIAEYEFFQPQDAKYLEPRMLSGRDVEAGEAPYQLSLLYKDIGFICGAALLVDKTTGRQYALSAANCIANSETKEIEGTAADYKLRGGSNNRNEGQTLQVAKMRFAKVWVNDKFLDDLAVILFDGSFELSDHLKPIEMSDDARRLRFKGVYVSGWGSRKDGIPSVQENVPELLHIVKLPLVKYPECKPIYAKFGHRVIWDMHVCAGPPEGQTDTCRQGDLGGPAVAKDQEGEFLAGITSYGIGCKEPGIPAVFALLGRKTQAWIKKTVADMDEKLKKEG